MARIFENDGAPLQPGDVDGMAEFMDEQDDDGPTGDALRDPVPDYGTGSTGKPKDDRANGNR